MHVGLNVLMAQAILQLEIPLEVEVVQAQIVHYNSTDLLSF